MVSSAHLSTNAQTSKRKHIVFPESETETEILDDSEIESSENDESDAESFDEDEHEVHGEDVAESTGEEEDEIESVDSSTSDDCEIAAVKSLDDRTVSTVNNVNVNVPVTTSGGDRLSYTVLLTFGVVTIASSVCCLGLAYLNDRCYSRL